MVWGLFALILAVSVHEAAHAIMAYWCGDKTAYRLGRVTLNPLAHIDVVGTLVVPCLFLLSGTSFLIGWAKPVPVSVQRLFSERWGMIWVALAGPISNALMAWIASYFMHITFFRYVVQINLILMVFNLIPIPPLDGSRLVIPFLPAVVRTFLLKWESFGMIAIVLLMSWSPLQLFLYESVQWCFLWLIRGVQ